MGLNMLKELQKHTFIVVGEEHYTPLGAIRSLGEEGIRPIAIILKSDRGRVASLSKYIKQLYLVESYADSLAIIQKYKNIEYKAIVIPCDDIIVDFLDNNYELLKDDFIIDNAIGQSGRIAHFEKKVVLCDLAMRNGVNVAKTWVVKKGDIPKDIVYPIITKPGASYEGWKQDYFVCGDEKELLEAYAKIKGQDLLLQQYIKKKNELCLDGFAINDGRDVYITISSNYTYVLPDYYSMEMVISNFNNKKLEEALNKMFAEIGYNGIFSVEFLVDANDKLWFLEINFRNSTWSYASTKLGMNLPVLWALGMINGKEPGDIIKNIPAGYKAMAEIPDFEQRVRRFHMLTFKEWIKEMKSCDCLFFFNRCDMKPYINVWKNKVLNILGKKLRRC